MPIITDFGPTVQDYLAHFGSIAFPRPEQCPGCGASHTFIGHGFYPRKPKDQIQVYQIWLKRWFCKACHTTLSILPSFLLRYRHYLLVVIQQVVVARFEDHASWQQTAQRCAPAGLPSPRTIGRWCHAFAAQAAGWWAVVQAALARQDSASPALDPLGPAAGPLDAPRALLHAATHLLAWAQTRWPEVGGYGLTDRLRFLWHWGGGHGLLRLV
jgi:transposase-like protein